MMLSGSIAFLIARITLTASPCSATKKSILPQPMPCSPLHVPSSDNAEKGDGYGLADAPKAG
jgi:hypothetical protein